MVRLPPPPQFNLPPPPMPVSGLFDTKLISQLTCSSIQQQSQQRMDSAHLILFASACVITAILLLTITLTWFLLTRRKKILDNNHHTSPSKPTTTIQSVNDLSTCSSRSYETVSSEHTGIYIESVDTSATTCSIDTTGGLCFECYHQHNNVPTTPYYHILSIPDVIPN